MGRTSSPRGASRAHVTSLIRHVRALKVYVFLFSCRRREPSRVAATKVGFDGKENNNKIWWWPSFVKLSLPWPHNNKWRSGKPPEASTGRTVNHTHTHSHTQQTPVRGACFAPTLKLDSLAWRNSEVLVVVPSPSSPTLIPIFHTTCVPSNEPRLCTQSPQVYVYLGYFISVHFSSFTGFITTQ